MAVDRDIGKGDVRGCDTGWGEFGEEVAPTTSCCGWEIVGAVVGCDGQCGNGLVVAKAWSSGICVDACTCGPGTTSTGTGSGVFNSFWTGVMAGASVRSLSSGSSVTLSCGS